MASRWSTNEGVAEANKRAVVTLVGMRPEEGPALLSCHEKFSPLTKIIFKTISMNIDAEENSFNS